MKRSLVRQEGRLFGMTKGDRTELVSLIRKRERVMKAAAAERAAQMLAEFDTQIAAIYKFDDDKVWAAAVKIAKKAVADAQKKIEARCKTLGIPPEFSPGLTIGWYGRGANAVAGRRSELRRMAKSKIDALELETRTSIERLALAAQTEVVSHGLESAAAREFIDRMPDVKILMPPVTAKDVKMLLDTKRKKDATEYRRIMEE